MITSGQVDQKLKIDIFIDFRTNVLYNIFRTYSVLENLFLGVLPHIDVLMAVRFLRRGARCPVDICLARTEVERRPSSDYIETLWESNGKEDSSYANNC